ncbi:MAG: MFS transporter [Anaerolineaceae bacterium]
METAQTKSQFPRQFWLMLGGAALSSLGTTMIWPFLLIFVSSRLNLPMATVTSLMTINSIVGLISSIGVGSLLDRFGRKWIMTIGILGSGIIYLGYLGANQFWQFVLLMGMSGLFGPLQRVGASAMIADMFEGDQRRQAYALFRTAVNIGFGLGPILGGLALQVSYNFGLLAAFSGLSIFGLITVIFIKETLPPELRTQGESLLASLRGYIEALKVRVFRHMLGAYTLQEICARLIWVFLAIYSKTNFGIPEAVYGIIPTTNAAMVVFLQVLVTRLTRKHSEVKVMTFGAGFYMLSMVVIALSNGFWGFLLAMVVCTIGELITAPTATVFVANLAPPEKRGRYLGLHGLTFYVAMSIGPLGAGILTDNFGMRAPWWGGAIVGALSVFSFWLLQHKINKQRPKLSDAVELI